LQTSYKILLIILIFFFTKLEGQDIHFSQYFNSPLSLNPSETGNFEGDWRAFLNYRNQWRAISYPFRTFSGGYDQHLNIEKHNVSVGGYVLSDQSGSVSLRCNQVYLSGAYARTINDNYLRGGLQVGYVMKSLKYDELLFADDWNETSRTWDSDYSEDVMDKSQLSYLDINIGVGWARKIKQYDAEVGLAVYHVNRPKESFYGSTSSRVPMRFAFQTAVKTNLSPNLYVRPGILFYSVSGSRNMMIGGQAGYAMQGNRFNVKEVYGGLYLRNGLADPTDAIMAMVGVQVRKIAINISYDVNVSSLRTYTHSRGAFEISIIYRSITTIVKTFTIPCERI
jgi:type IX secretion system PorP/SprF family membrane protein